jgi:hypothetical protein
LPKPIDVFWLWMQLVYFGLDNRKDEVK